MRCNNQFHLCGVSGQTGSTMCQLGAGAGFVQIYLVQNQFRRLEPIQCIQYVYDPGQKVRSDSLWVFTPQVAVAPWTGRARRTDGAAIIPTSAGQFRFILHKSECKFKLELPWKIHLLGKGCDECCCLGATWVWLHPVWTLRPFTFTLSRPAGSRFVQENTEKLFVLVLLVSRSTFFSVLLFFS